LSKGRWQRIARELEVAGYLTRQITNGDSGQWKWNIVFNPRPPLCGDTIAGFSSDGFTRDGSTSAGETSNKGIPSKKKNTTRTTTTANGPKPRSVDSRFEARQVNVVVDKYAEPYRDILLKILSEGELADDGAQQIADELAGVLEAIARGRHVAIANVRGWISRMTKLHREGDFTADFGRLVAARRRLPPVAESVGERRPDQRVVSACLEQMRFSLRYAGAPEADITPLAKPD